MLVACRDVSLLDKALTRAGRLQHSVCLQAPTVHDIVAMLTYHLKRMPLDAAVTVDKVLELFRSQVVLLGVSVSGADVAMVCRNALLMALQESLSRGNGIETDVNSSCSNSSKSTNSVHLRHFCRLN